jgi:hypothetical protein
MTTGIAPVSRLPGVIERTAWLNTGVRVLLALFGAYGVALQATALLSVVLPLSRIEATMAAIMLGFVIQTLGVIWVVAARTVARAVLGLALPAVLLGLLLQLLSAGGAA